MWAHGRERARYARRPRCRSGGRSSSRRGETPRACIRRLSVAPRRIRGLVRRGFRIGRVGAVGLGVFGVQAERISTIPGNTDRTATGRAKWAFRRRARLRGRELVLDAVRCFVGRQDPPRAEREHAVHAPGGGRATVNGLVDVEYGGGLGGRGPPRGAAQGTGELRAEECTTVAPPTISWVSF